MTALWPLIGGLIGALRMLAAGALVFLAGFFYVTVWVLPAARTEAKRGYVLESQLVAAQAKATELQRQLDSQRIVIDAYELQAQNRLAKEAADDEATEKAIALNEAARVARGRKCDGGIDQSDIEFLRQ